MENLFNTLSYH